MTSTAPNDNSTAAAVVVDVNNYIGGKFVPPSTGQYLSVTSPLNILQPIGRVGLSSANDVQDAVQAAKMARTEWSSRTIKARAAVMLRFHALIQSHTQELAELIVKENGKNITEAIAEVSKGNETVEWACGLPQVAQGHMLRVSSAVTCYDRRDPLGVVASIVPFNFPFMVPMWTIPIALVMGNTVVLKPSEKVPLTMRRVAELFRDAGLPDGVFNMIQGTKDAVEAIIDHPDVRAVTFVGSSPVASLVASRCRTLNKRVTALGGAKNHLVALEDCEADGASSDIVVSYCGCKGERCMAASVLILVGENETLLNAVISKASQIQPGTGPGQMGPVIDERSYKSIHRYLQDAEQQPGTKILLDGRSWNKDNQNGYWVGPTVVLHASPHDRMMQEEVFGPVLSVYVASSWEEAIQIENANPFGNAACIYTTNGGNADWFLHKFRAAMLGVNIGIPVPREPFSFGGLYGTKSKFGEMDITGEAGMEFFTNRIKVTSKWPIAARPAVAAVDQSNGPADHANFAGTM